MNDALNTMADHLVIGMHGSLRITGRDLILHTFSHVLAVADSSVQSLPIYVITRSLLYDNGPMRQQMNLQSNRSPKYA